MISRKARTALRKARQGKQCGYVEILKQGEEGYRTGSANPYATDTEDHATWAEGYADAKEQA